MLSGLREQVQRVLYAVPAGRKPALRRSDAQDALFATDLPLIAESTAVEAFREEMFRLGWQTQIRGSWILLDAAVPVPDASVPAEAAGECGCCIALLQRHPDAAPSEAFIRMVVKAADAGRQPFERICTQLHAEFAVRLRRHEALPGALLPYLCHAWNRLY